MGDDLQRLAGEIALVKLAGEQMTTVVNVKVGSGGLERSVPRVERPISRKVLRLDDLVKIVIRVSHDSSTMVKPYTRSLGRIQKQLWGSTEAKNKRAACLSSTQCDLQRHGVGNDKRGWLECLWRSR